MATPTTTSHCVSVAVAQMRATATSVADAPVWSMTDREAAATLIELQALKAQITELEGRVVVHADEQQVGQDRGASSTAVWLANQTNTTRPVAHGIVNLGRALHAHPATRAALAGARIGADQARVILRWVATIPEEHQATAERHLLDLAAEHDAKGLNKLGKRLWEVIDPDGADARESDILAKEEARALRDTYLKIWDDGHGRTHLQGVVPTFAGAALKKALLATMAAKHQNATKGAGTGQEQMGHAFCELITQLPAKALPKTGGINATLVVTISEDSLLGRLEQAGRLDTGDRISANLARRLACEADILPAVLGGVSQVLDLGRSQRLFAKAQRLAITVQQGGKCAADGCDRTTGLHAHHLRPWSAGGTTDLANAVGLCHWHHVRAHDTRYDLTRQPSGAITFHRRP